jgi:hypothetical protein
MIEWNERIKLFWKGLFKREVPSVPVVPPTPPNSSDSVESYHVDRYLNMLERANEVKPIVIEPTILCPLCNEEQQMEQLDFMTHAFTKHDMSRLEGEKMFFNVLKRTKKVGV